MLQHDQHLRLNIFQQDIAERIVSYEAKKTQLKINIVDAILKKYAVFSTVKLDLYFQRTIESFVRNFFTLISSQQWHLLESKVQLYDILTH